MAQAPPNGRMNVLPLLKIHRSSEEIELKARNTATLFYVVTENTLLSFQELVTINNI